MTLYCRPRGKGAIAVYLENNCAYGLDGALVATMTGDAHRAAKAHAAHRAADRAAHRTAEAHAAHRAAARRGAVLAPEIVNTAFASTFAQECSLLLSEPVGNGAAFASSVFANCAYANPDIVTYAELVKGFHAGGKRDYGFPKRDIRLAKRDAYGLPTAAPTATP